MITNTKIGYGGRLGNQMFQYAMLMGVSNRTASEVGIPHNNALTVKDDGCLDLYTGNWIPYKFVLDECFDMQINWIEKTDVSVGFKNLYKERFFHFDDDVFNQEDFTDFDGYFQSYKYFEHIMPQIQKTFVFKDDIIKKATDFHNEARKSGEEVIAIHVRRGDYLGIPDILPVCEPEYYQEALSYFSDKPYKFLICSDDIQWCIDTFGNDDSTYYPVSNDQYADMCAMSMCDHHIIANSTFSLWAALLNTKETKKVIAPKTWFGPKLAHYDTKDLIPKGWITI